MELRTLRYFLTIAREGNIARAAASLYITQPALSRQLKNLEEELGVKLYRRGSRGVELTKRGELLKRRAEEILALVDKTADECSSPVAEMAGDVFIGVGESYASRFLAKLARNVRDRHPQIRFHMYDGNQEDLAERLDRGILDFCVLVHPANLTKYNSIRIPEDDVWGVVVRRDNPLAKKEAIGVEDLLDEPLILSQQTLDSTMTQNDFANWFGDDFERLNVAGTYNLVFYATLLVAEGVGSALTLNGPIRTAESDVLCFRPLDPPLRAASDLVWKRHRLFSPAAEVFFDEVRRYLQPDLQPDGDGAKEGDVSSASVAADA